MSDSKFRHELYDLDETSGHLTRKPGFLPPSTAEEQNAEYCSVLEAITTFLQVDCRLFHVLEQPERVGTNAITRLG